MTRKLIDCVRHSDLSLSHHIAFWNLIEDQLPEGFLEDAGEGGSLWISAQEPKPAAELVSAEQALAVFGRAPTAAQLKDLNDCLRRFDITSPARIRHFLAQIGHESGGLRWMKELADGSAYEGRKDLGNTEPGDGPRFKGAGAIQLTGRRSYQRFADFIGDPQVMEGVDYVAKRYPFVASGFWWRDNGMNALVDSGASCRQVSAKVNGRDPALGLKKREAYYAKAVKAIPLAAARQPAAASGGSAAPQWPTGLVGPRKRPDLKPGDHHLVADARAESLTAWTHDGKRLWSIPCLCQGRGADWKKTGGDTPPGLYLVGKVYRDYEQDPSATFSADRRSYGWYSFDLEGQEGQEGPGSRHGRDGIMIHGGGTACGWPGAWAPRQALYPTLGCIRLHNVDLRDRILPLLGLGRIWVSVLQEAG
ncbi:MAG: L,D-transpeptidase family protein [Steroidobacteraceae bacterium]